MISLKRKETGFTIIELLIVIVVIGILAALVITTFSGIQKRARDTERETDVKAIHSQLESYYAQGNSTYPSLAQLQNNTWVGTNMKGIDLGALSTPNSTTNNVSGTAGIATYQYVPTGCDASSENCTDYTLTATKENGPVFTKEGLN